MNKPIVELQVPADVLRALAADSTALGGWAGVVADLAGRLDCDTGSAGPYRATPPGEPPAPRCAAAWRSAIGTAS